MVTFHESVCPMSFSADPFKYCMKMDDRCDQADVVDPVSEKCKRFFQWNYKNRNKTGYVGNLNVLFVFLILNIKQIALLPLTWWVHVLMFNKNKINGMARLLNLVVNKRFYNFNNFKWYRRKKQEVRNT